MEHPTLSQVTTTSTNVIKFTLPEPPTWMQMATRLHNDGRLDEFRQVCSIATIRAQALAFPDDRSFFALIDRMKIVETDSASLDFVTKRIKEVYGGVYPISDHGPVEPSELADVIPFRADEQEVGQ